MNHKIKCLINICTLRLNPRYRQASENPRFQSLLKLSHNHLNTSLRIGQAPKFLPEPCAKRASPCLFFPTQPRSFPCLPLGLRQFIDFGLFGYWPDRKPIDRWLAGRQTRQDETWKCHFLRLLRGANFPSFLTFDVFSNFSHPPLCKCLTLVKVIIYSRALELSIIFKRNSQHPFQHSIIFINNSLRSFSTPSTLKSPTSIKWTTPSTSSPSKRKKNDVVVHRNHRRQPVLHLHRHH